MGRGTQLRSQGRQRESAGEQQDARHTLVDAQPPKLSGGLCKSWHGEGQSKGHDQAWSAVRTASEVWVSSKLESVGETLTNMSVLAEPPSESLISIVSFWFR